MAIKTMKAAELILDWNLWPRFEAQELDATNVARMKEALRAGVVLPPVIASKKDFRVTDGFHRTKAHLSVYGDDAEIKVELKDYKNDQEMFMDAIRLNAHQGLPLSPRDKVHAFHTARRMKATVPVIAAALGMTTEALKIFVDRRTAKTQDGQNIPLSGGALELAGKKLTQAQEHFVRTASGTRQIVNARILVNSLKSDSMVLDEKTIAVLTELRDLLNEVLLEVAA